MATYGAIPGAPLSQPMFYRQLVTKWLSTLPDLGYQFARLDINGDGVLTHDELVAAIAPFGSEWALLPEALMAMGDVNGNGCISLPELHHLAQLLQQNAMLRRQVGVPGLWGPNGRLMAAGTAGGFLGQSNPWMPGGIQLGRVNTAAYSPAMLQAQRSLVLRWMSTFPDADAEFRVLDANGDGFVCYEEIVRAVMPYGAEWSGLPDALFAMADVDGNGLISLHEFRQLAMLLKGNMALRISLGLQ